MMHDTHAREIKEQLYDRDPTALKCTALCRVKIAVARFFRKMSQSLLSGLWSTCINSPLMHISVFPTGNLASPRYTYLMFSFQRLQVPNSVYNRQLFKKCCKVKLSIAVMLQAGEMAQLVTYLIGKHEGLSSNPGAYIKTQVWRQMFVIPVPRRKRWENLCRFFARVLVNLQSQWQTLYQNKIDR